jgi:dTDP-4-amino-4,6-dideoxygalactose transaminase
VFEALRARGIGVNLHYIPVNTQPYYRDLGFHGDECPRASQYYREAISLPMYSALSFDDQDLVVHAVSESLR